jgi:hypothetical protein
VPNFLRFGFPWPRFFRRWIQRICSSRDLVPRYSRVVRQGTPFPVRVLRRAWFPLARPFSQSKIWSPRGQISLCFHSGFGAVFRFNLHIDFSAHHHSSVSASTAVPLKLISFLA